MNTSCVYIKATAILYFKVVDFSWVLGSGSNLDKDGFWPIRVKYLLHQPAKEKVRRKYGKRSYIPLYSRIARIPVK